jgi:hypothetical protein
MADKWQPEASATFSKLQKTKHIWAEKFLDVQFSDEHGNVTHHKKAKARVYPKEGRPDMIYMGIGNGLWTPGGFVEVKSAQGDKGQRFDFNEWREDQRKWYYDYSQPMKLQLWFWLCMGHVINRDPYPRITMLFPVQILIELEQNANRKSLPYSEAVSELAIYQLKWLGGGKWDIPQTHPFWKQFKG